MTDNRSAYASERFAQASLVVREEFDFVRWSGIKKQPTLAHASGDVIAHRRDSSFSSLLVLLSQNAAGAVALPRCADAAAMRTSPERFSMLGMVVYSPSRMTKCGARPADTPAARPRGAHLESKVQAAEWRGLSGNEIYADLTGFTWTRAPARLVDVLRPALHARLLLAGGAQA